ncbi:cytochrome c biogenesis protein CcsA [Pseudomonas nicosulfuronedens]|uniref:Cytochrome C biogenesis protein CcmF n=1 Tax=Pseudomonas nicosulfuronedens TaxID=2571105 RepID=A0A5R9QNJ9_9PSED|nr:cytochrome c biogenesis protein CcsA [Pseudomonas nicosulfuronedens]MDH1012894.1 cytochrome c biogenesis protein CcsA [Pseudomonas nicosulfuronedens]MDH1979421.1 cytochrome c biogenesis protein CcsA [Pseudomonas nicosulfuronedens]MDH2030465.1 cytochrome c biogenesis protein CcsA [Pseudomonas nicosulfuronedens]TLX71238.1 cytochrome C biogenesis protein CcmF [Pseudomonas nicosulfuronedens]
MHLSLPWRTGPLAAALICLLLWLLPGTGNALLWGLAALIALGAVRQEWRALAWPVAVGALCGACLALALHLVADHFQLRYAWLYSSAALPAYLKFSNLWGGDEGTVLLLGTFCMAIALRSAGLPGWAGRGMALIAAWYVATAAWLGPFSATPAEWLAAQPSQGMNAHLQTFWMSLHAPLILCAYAWVLAPAGAALEALGRGGHAYGWVMPRYSRWAWLILSAGIGVGMAWAMEDFTYGQLWHWDPVQTSAFIIWALLGAVLHGARRWRADGAYARLLPALSLLAAAMACGAMAVTRSTVLASSHRYIGTTSWLSHLALAFILLAFAAFYLLSGWRLRKRAGRRRGASDWTLDVAIYLFAGIGLLALGALLQAHLYEWLEMERPSELKPFFETLTAWATTAEMDSLRRAFDQWDVNGYGLAHWVVPLLAAIGLMGGYSFLRRCGRPRLALLATVLMAAVMFWTGWRGGWLSGGYNGDGMLSQNIVRVLPWLDAALLGGVFLMGSCLLWGMQSLWRSRRVGNLRYSGGLALVHGGAVIALVGGLAATALNSYQQISIPPGTSFEQWHAVIGGMQMRVSPDSSRPDFSGYHAVAKVELRDGERTLAGHALFQDSRGNPPAYQGPVRQLCEILDYHYARFASDRGYVLHPFIVRGWSGDLQIWVPASARLLKEPGDDIESVVVVRRFPFLSLVWVGLITMLFGALMLPAGGALRKPDHTASEGVSRALSQS